MNEYEEFLSWAYKKGLDFPCTSAQFYARAAAYAKGNVELIARLCERGIGSDWQTQ